MTVECVRPSIFRAGTIWSRFDNHDQVVVLSSDTQTVTYRYEEDRLNVRHTLSKAEYALTFRQG